MLAPDRKNHACVCSTRTIGSAMLGREERRRLSKTDGRGTGEYIRHAPLLVRGKPLFFADEHKSNNRPRHSK